MTTLLDKIRFYIAWFLQKIKNWFYFDQDYKKDDDIDLEMGHGVIGLGLDQIVNNDFENYKQTQSQILKDILNTFTEKYKEKPEEIPTEVNKIMENFIKESVILPIITNIEEPLTSDEEDLVIISKTEDKIFCNGVELSNEI